MLTLLTSSRTIHDPPKSQNSQHFLQTWQLGSWFGTLNSCPSFWIALPLDSEQNPQTKQWCQLSKTVTWQSDMWERNTAYGRNTYHVGIGYACRQKNAKSKESTKDYKSISASGSGHPPQATMEARYQKPNGNALKKISARTQRVTNSLRDPPNFHGSAFFPLGSNRQQNACNSVQKKTVTQLNHNWLKASVWRPRKKTCKQHNKKQEQLWKWLYNWSIFHQPLEGDKINPSLRSTNPQLLDLKLEINTTC